MFTLFWNADSPYCRLLLWQLAGLGAQNKLNLQHMSWADIRNERSGGRLGSSATVPCLHAEKGKQLSDSLRIVAHLAGHDFLPWFLSSDGEAYRLFEGQLSRVLYGLYDSPNPAALKKIEERWQLVFSSATAHAAHELSPQLMPEPATPFALITLHVLVVFCLQFKPEWRDTIPSEWMNALRDLERTHAFQWMEQHVSQHNPRVQTRIEALSSGG